MTEEANEGGERLGCGWVVRGRVQGVGFRWWTVRQAESMGVEGTVENLADGSVRVMALGSRDALERLGEALTRGPGPARVDGVDAIPCELDGEWKGFSIVR